MRKCLKKDSKFVLKKHPRMQEIVPFFFYKFPDTPSLAAPSVDTAPSYMHENFTPINETHHYGARFIVTSNVTRPDSNLSIRDSKILISLE